MSKHLLLRLVLLAIIANLVSFSVLADINVDDPKQSIRYWQQYQVSESENVKVVIANKVFSELIRLWPTNRSVTPPALAIVNSKEQLWAASLKDGNILLSEAALGFILAETGVDDLAFVLAHELAHQQNDDFENNQFLRLAHAKQQENKMQQRETMADELAIINMALVGYNPFGVIDGKSFFELWAENSWHMLCDENRKLSSVCEQAHARTEKVKKRLRQVAKKTAIFNMATQSYVVGDYAMARQLFVEYEKTFSGYVVLNNIGLTYLMEVMAADASLNKNVSQLSLPLFLNTQSAFNPDRMTKQLRGSFDFSHKAARDRQHWQDKLSKANRYFQRAIKIAADDKAAYQYLILSFLLQNKVLSAKALLEERYKVRFKSDIFQDFLNGMIAFTEDDIVLAEHYFNYYLQHHVNENVNAIYSASYNLATVYRLQQKFDAEKMVWNKLAKVAGTNTNVFLFRLALDKINPSASLNTNNHRIKMSKKYSQKVGSRHTGSETKSLITSIWMNGEQIKIFNAGDAQYYAMNKDNIVLHNWQSATNKNVSAMGVRIGDTADRPLKVLGLPQRQLLSLQGSFLNYDDLGISYNVLNDKVVGWFYY